jgi:beta-1,2-mannobiose phosphorylase / 1,2-beta-oligomannan phosphorylase
MALAKPTTDKEGLKLCHLAGVMVLSKEHPRAICYRSRDPILKPDLSLERRGIVANVLFAQVSAGETILAHRAASNISYEIANDRIGVARIDKPTFSAKRTRQEGRGKVESNNS